MNQLRCIAPYFCRIVRDRWASTIAWKKAKTSRTAHQLMALISLCSVIVAKH